VSWPRRPVIHEVDTWVWLGEVGRAVGRDITLAEVPAESWDALCLPGVDAVWLMGVWERSTLGRAIALADPNNVASFRAALPDLDADADVTGSPYAVHRFVVDQHFGGPAGLAAARAALATRGARLVLDFVPNHVAPDHPWTDTNPDYFVPGTDGARYAAGRDPYFAPWDDTIQVNAFSMSLRRAATATVLEIAEQCDGVRCDMAMLVLNHVFAQTWGERVGLPPPEEYWTHLISSVRTAHPDFVFMAEAYWDLEHELQDLGFGFCYDKRLYDRLVHDDAASVRAHLGADLSYQEKLVRFIENHDEPRAAAVFPPDRERAAAVIVATLPGATLWYEGQLSGRKVRVPVFLARRQAEPVDRRLLSFYERLLARAERPGQWQLAPCEGWPDNQSAERLLAWTWTSGADRRLVVVNYSDAPAQARVRLPWDDLAGRSRLFVDLMDGSAYERDGDELGAAGLYVDRPGWGFHLFRVG
jgi:Alpha amylase, catalytic domain